MNPYNSELHKTNSLPCCRYPHSHAEHFELDPINNSKTWIELQQNIDSNKKLDSCNHCWRDELSGNQSYRQASNEQFKDIILDGSYREKKLRYLELMFGNACNLACRSCSSIFSSRWTNIDKYLLINGLETMRTDSIRFTDWRKLDLSNLISLKLMGGEPFYQKTILELLEYLHEKDILKNITLQIPTNGTITLSNRWIDLLNEAKGVLLFVSIDAYGKLNDYMREGSSWETIAENLNSYAKLISGNNRYISINTVVSVYNVNCLDELAAYVSENYSRVHHYHDLAYYPNHLDIALLPDPIKEKLLLKNLPEKIKTYLTSKETSMDAFNKLKKMTTALDEYHNKNLVDYNKEMYDWIYNV